MATMLGVIALVAISFHLLPRVARRDVYFGVTVSPTIRDGTIGRSVLRRYLRQIWSHAIVAGVLVAITRAPVASGGLLLAQTFGASVAYAQARRSLLAYGLRPAGVREAEIGPRPSLPGGVAGQLGPFVILLVAAVYVGLHWQQVPSRIPRHWNLAGRPDGWYQKSVSGAFLLHWIGLVMCGLTAASAYGVLHWSRLPRVAGEGGRHDRRVRRVNLLLMLVGEYVLAMFVAWASIAPLVVGPASVLPLAMRIAPFALVIGGVVAMAWVRAGAPQGPQGATVGDTTPDVCWRFGRIYWNSADPAVFVEKRFGVGYTLNFGNRLAWLFVVLAVLGVLVPVLLVG